MGTSWGTGWADVNTVQHVQGLQKCKMPKFYFHWGKKWLPENLGDMFTDKDVHCFYWDPKFWCLLLDIRPTQNGIILTWSLSCWSFEDKTVHPTSLWNLTAASQCSMSTVCHRPHSCKPLTCFESAAEFPQPPHVWKPTERVCCDGARGPVLKRASADDKKTDSEKQTELREGRADRGVFCARLKCPGSGWQTTWKQFIFFFPDI